MRACVRVSQRPFITAWGIGIGFDNLYQMWEVFRDFILVREPCDLSLVLIYISPSAP